MMPDEMLDELPVVTALRTLSVFTADQGGAYREHYASLATTFGPDVSTQLGRFLEQWAVAGTAGVVILTGNAGTGKTAAAEAYSRAAGGSLPTTDEMIDVAQGRRVIKDLSGMPESVRASNLSVALKAAQGQTLICANEGVLRDAIEKLLDPLTANTLNVALRHGAAREGALTIINLNRQRPTGDRLWSDLLNYVTRTELWVGCVGCPFETGGCSMRSNADSLRKEEVRDQLRTLFRLAAGEAVPTLREVLAILSWAIVGKDSCGHVKKAHRDLGSQAFTAADAYFSRVLGGGMSRDDAERSPLLTGLARAGLGTVSDLEIDGWLRDTNGSPAVVRAIAGAPDEIDVDTRANDRLGMIGSRSPLDRVRTRQKVMTFHSLGEMVSTDEDLTRVEDGLDALVRGDGGVNAPAQMLWRQRVYFEASEALGGAAQTTRRLLSFRHAGDLFELAASASRGKDTVLALNEIVRGLNFLVTGFASPNEGLVVPDPACLFARDPGAFRPAKPSLVHGLVPIRQLSVAVPDAGLVNELLDVDHVDVDLMVDGDPTLSLRIRPRMYEAIREAAEFGGPVGQGVAEMNDLRGFYGRLASYLVTEMPSEATLRVADPESVPPALVRITLPLFVGR